MKNKILLNLFITSTLLANTYTERDYAELTKKQRETLALAQKWINANPTSTVGDNGEIVFLFGESMPTIITAPLRLTDIVLQPGEIIKDVQIADSVRWIVSLSISGDEPYLTSHIIIKPTDKNLQTNLSIMTNKRVYRLNLISESKNYMPAVSFRYPNNKFKTLSQYKKAIEQIEQNSRHSSHTIDQYGVKSMYLNEENEDSIVPQKPDQLDFGYKIKGKASFKPLRVYNDGQKTYIQMPKNMKFYEAPALMVLNGKAKEIVNYRLKFDTFIVDRLFEQAVLILGVGGKQKKVIIKKESYKTNQDIVNDVLYDLSKAKRSDK